MCTGAVCTGVVCTGVVCTGVVCTGVVCVLVLCVPLVWLRERCGRGLVSLELSVHSAEAVGAPGVEAEGWAAPGRDFGRLPYSPRPLLLLLM